MRERERERDLVFCSVSCVKSGGNVVVVGGMCTNGSIDCDREAKGVKRSLCDDSGVMESAFV